jgi:diacylglycerol kinase family enzyme
MKQADTSAIDLTKLRIGAVLNISSGSCDAECAAKMAAILAERRIVPTGIETVEGKHIKASIEKMLAQKVDILIVLGGDGTIRTAAELCAHSETKLIPLPGGTMNMLPIALYGEGSWDDILIRTLGSPAFVGVGGGEVEGHRFFCAGIFGSPALWADAREAVRKNRWLDVVDKVVGAYRRTFSRKIRYRFDKGTRGETIALSAICPLISAAVASDAQAFDTVILDPRDLGQAAQLAWSAVFSEWRRDDNVTSVRADTVEISSAVQIPAILDGEKVTLPRAAKIRYLSTCFTAVTPR